MGCVALAGVSGLNDTQIPDGREEVKDEKNIKGEELEGTTDIMGARRYYKTWKEAESHRRKGQRIYLDPVNGYYIVTPKKRSWWDIF